MSNTGINARFGTSLKEPGREGWDGCASTQQDGSAGAVSCSGTSGPNGRPVTPGPQVSGIEAMVCARITERQDFGFNKYGVTVADNPLSLLEWLQHALDECLDQAVYIRRAMEEIKAKGDDLK